MRYERQQEQRQSRQAEKEIKKLAREIKKLEKKLDRANSDKQAEHYIQKIKKTKSALTNYNTNFL